jgi:hypothetical protein
MIEYDRINAPTDNILNSKHCAEVEGTIPQKPEMHNLVIQKCERLSEIHAFT